MLPMQRILCHSSIGLSAAGNAELRRYDRDWSAAKMNGWEQAINHYLKTGKLITAVAWE